MTKRGEIFLTALCTGILVFGLQTWWKKLVPRFEVRVAKPEILEKPVEPPSLIIFWMNGESQTNPVFPVVKEGLTVSNRLEFGFANNGQVYWRRR